MLSETLSFQVAAGGTNANAMANSRYATLPFPARITYFAVEDTADTAADGLVQITHGNVIVRSLGAIPRVATGEGPLRDRHQIASGGAAAGDRIVVEAQNTSGTAANFRVELVIEQMV